MLAVVRLPERALEPGQELVRVPELAQAQLPALAPGPARVLLRAQGQELARERLPAQARGLALVLVLARALVPGRAREPELAQGPVPVLARVLVQPVARVPGPVLRQQAQRHPLAGPRYIPQGW